MSAELRNVTLAAKDMAREIERLRARVDDLESQRAALVARLRAGQQWREGRTPPLVTEDYVAQSELRAIFGIALTAPWDAAGEDPCHPCGCPKRFNRHAWGCPGLAAEDPHGSPLDHAAHARMLADGLEEALLPPSDPRHIAEHAPGMRRAIDILRTYSGKHDGGDR